jgi:ferritin-like metal-binding protein YciE
MKLGSLRDVLVMELKDLYSAEEQLVEALPKMAKAAMTPELEEAFTTHLQQTKQQVERLEEIAGILDIKLGGQKCKGMEGLIEEGSEVVKEDESVLRDLALIGAAQRVEHYEMAGYGTARTVAEALGEEEVVDLLQDTLDEEGEADELLTQISESIISDLEGEL